ncbi:hypothetical protein, partial [Escherichia coli]
IYVQARLPHHNPSNHVDIFDIIQETRV